MAAQYQAAHLTLLEAVDAISAGASQAAAKKAVSRLLVDELGGGRWRSSRFVTLTPPPAGLFARNWTPNPATIDWQNSTIDSYQGIRRVQQPTRVTIARSALGLFHKPKGYGPAAGSIDRYGHADRKLFPEIQSLIAERQFSAREAVRELSDRLAGRGTIESKIKRVADRFLRESS